MLPSGVRGCVPAAGVKTSRRSHESSSANNGEYQPSCVSSPRLRSTHGACSLCMTRLQRSAPVVRSTVSASAAAAPPTLKPYIEKLIGGDSLSSGEAKEVCAAILAGADHTQVRGHVCPLQLCMPMDQSSYACVRLNPEWCALISAIVRLSLCLSFCACVGMRVVARVRVSPPPRRCQPCSCSCDETGRRLRK